jgi:bifunctional non-homologous end joining protein LigD
MGEHNKRRISVKADIFPDWFRPQLASLASQPPTGEGWIHEIKLDGYRVLTFKAPGRRSTPHLMSRNHKDWTENFSDVVDEISKLRAESFILDGEVCAINEKGLTSFQLLQNSIGSGGKRIYFIFDLLYLNGVDLRPFPLSARKQLLKQLLPKRSRMLKYVQHDSKSGRQYFETACAAQWEGIVSKWSNAPYRSERSRSWLKIKCSYNEEFAIVGYTLSSAGPGMIGALLLGEQNSKASGFKYCGKVGTGFSNVDRSELLRRLKRDLRSKSQCFPIPRVSAQWVQPKLLAQVQFTERTGEGMLRHPSFLGIRADKSATELLKGS